MNLKTNLANRKNYGSSRSVTDIKYIVIHYTGNDGDTDENNGKYFKNNVTGTSAHYFVDRDSITQSVPDNFVAWHCGGKSYKHKSCRNSNSIGIEICDDVKNGTIYPSDKTIKNVLELTEYLMKKYNIPKENVIRHYDVTGKLCPAYWVDNQKWKTAFWNKLNVPKTNTSQNKNEAVTGQSVASHRVKVTADSLNIRSGAGTQHKIVGVIKDKGVYTITEVKGSWGKLKSGKGWISLNYTKRV